MYNPGMIIFVTRDHTLLDISKMYRMLLNTKLISLSLFAIKNHCIHVVCDNSVGALQNCVWRHAKQNVIFVFWRFFANRYGTWSLVVMSQPTRWWNVYLNCNVIASSALIAFVSLSSHIHVDGYGSQRPVISLSTIYHEQKYSSIVTC